MKKLMTTTFATLIAAAAFAAVGPGDKAPAFTLPGVTGKEVSLADFKGKTVVLEWTNHECPFVRKHYDGGQMQDLQKKYTGKDVVWLQICSSAPDKQGNIDAAKGKELHSDKKMGSTDLLLDPEGKVGKAYGAKTTPHMFVIDGSGTIVYAGAIDSDNSATYNKSAENYVASALDALADSKPIKTASTKPYGCSVKY